MSLTVGVHAYHGSVPFASVIRARFGDEGKIASVAELSCYRSDVNARLALFLFCVLLVACEHPSPPTYFPPDAPDLATKLGISESDWQALQQLSSEEKGMVMFGVAKPLPNVIEIEFGKPSDHLQDQGGPLYRYEFENGIWKKDETFVGVWNVHRSR